MKQLHLINDLTFPIPPNIKLKPRSKYQQWKFDNNYCKANTDKRCKNCKNLVIKEEAYKKFHKCILLGLSSSSATDIRLNNVCNLFTQKNADCQLCKHLDCDNNGKFICGLDNEILDHSGIYCSNFEEYIED